MTSTSTNVESVIFLLVRGVIALAIIGLGYYCIHEGIQFFMLPTAEKQDLHTHVLGLDITANGLGAIIFGTGIALGFIGLRAAPRAIKRKIVDDTENTEPGSARRRVEEEEVYLRHF
jgi:hypothetical protein